MPSSAETDLDNGQDDESWPTPYQILGFLLHHDRSWQAIAPTLTPLPSCSEQTFSLWIDSTAAPKRRKMGRCPSCSTT